MIDRSIKRLLQVKTMKQMCNRLEPKMLTVRTTKQTLAEESPAASPTTE
jgi:hypothetical protein